MRARKIEKSTPSVVRLLSSAGQARAATRRSSGALSSWYGAQLGRINGSSDHSVDGNQTLCWTHGDRGAASLNLDRNYQAYTNEAHVVASHRLESLAKIAAEEMIKPISQ